MNKNSVVILGASVLGLVGVAYVMSPRGSSTSTPATPTTTSATGAGAASTLPKLFPGASEKIASIAKLTITKGDKTVELVRTPAGSKAPWALANRAMFPATDDRVRDLVRRVVDLEILEPKTSEPSLYPRLGVEDPASPNATSTLVTLADASGAPIASLIIGKREDKLSQDPTSAGTYVRPAHAAQSALVKGRVSPSPDVADWFMREVLREARGTIASLVIQHPPTADATPGETITITRGGRGSESLDWKERPANRELADPMALQRPLQVIESLVVDDVKKAEEVDFTNATTATYTTLDGAVLTLVVVAKDAKYYVRVRASHDASRIAPPAEKFPQPTSEEQAMLAGRIAQIDESLSPWAFELPDYRYEQLTLRGESLLKPLAPPTTTSPGSPPGASEVPPALQPPPPAGTP